MKSPQCRTRWHLRCPREIECEDGSAYICECDCGHSGVVQSGRTEDFGSSDAGSIPAPGVPAALATEAIYHAPVSSFAEPVENEGMAPPPPHPQPFDRHRFRIAEERPVVDRHQPWGLGYCRECRYPTWTHEQEQRYLDDIICEDCHFLVIEQIAELRVKAQNQQATGYHNPFDRRGDL